MEPEGLGEIRLELRQHDASIKAHHTSIGDLRSESFRQAGKIEVITTELLGTREDIGEMKTQLATNGRDFKAQLDVQSRDFRTDLATRSLEFRNEISSVKRLVVGLIGTGITVTISIGGLIAVILSTHV